MALELTHSLVYEHRFDIINLIDSLFLCPSFLVSTNLSVHFVQLFGVNPTALKKPSNASWGPRRTREINTAEGSRAPIKDPRSKTCRCSCRLSETKTALALSGGQIVKSLYTHHMNHMNHTCYKSQYDMFYFLVIIICWTVFYQRMIWIDMLHHIFGDLYGCLWLWRQSAQLGGSMQLHLKAEGSGAKVPTDVSKTSKTHVFFLVICWNPLKKKKKNKHIQKRCLD